MRISAESVRLSARIGHVADQRRTSSRLGRLARRGPRGRRGPGRVGRLGRVQRTDTAERAAVAAPRLRQRPTGRLAILVVVLAVLVVSYASSLKAYLQQRHDMDALQQEIAQRQKSIDDLQEQKDRWKDPAYVEQQARERFGYVMPGDISYVALDANGNRIQPTSKLGKPSAVGEPTKPTAWWTDAWGSVELAGNPPKQGTGPATTIKPDQKE